jgi:transcriptional regulator with XRE-family HTH domain
LAANEPTELGRRIALARRELGLTQRELAERIGVMLGKVDAYETGLADPSPYLDRIAEVTGKNTLWFLHDDDPEEMLARLQRQADELTRREAALRKKEDELDLAHRRDGRPGDLEAREEALRAREAEIERAAARQAELREWTQTAERVAAELRQSVEEIERMRSKPSTAERPETASAFAARERRLAAREEAATALERELAQKLNEAVERARDHEQRWRSEMEAFESLRRLESDLQERERSVSRAEAELAAREKALGEGDETLPPEVRALQEAKLEAERRLVALRDGVIGTVAHLEAQMTEAEGEPSSVKKDRKRETAMDRPARGLWRRLRQDRR